MRAYNKTQKKGKFEKSKINYETGIRSVTRRSKEEARNANRSLKKGARQKSKAEIEDELYGKTYSTLEDVGI